MRILLFFVFTFLLLQSCDAIRESMVYEEEEGLSEEGMIVDEDYKLHLGPNEMPSGPGQCFAKCLIRHEVVLYETEYPIFTGDQTNNKIALDTVKHLVKVAHTRWLKKQKEGPCESNNPKDCMVWWMEEVSEEYKTIVVVRNMNSTNEFDLAFLPTLGKSEGNTEWREVLCDDDITPYIISDIQKVLFGEDKYPIEIDGNMDRKTREALVVFQKGNGLPIGQLDFHTLDYMGLDY